MFTKEQIEQLEQELDSSRIKTREKGNINLAYLEGFDIIETANKVFGYGHWDYAISKLEVASEEVNHNQNHIICYKAVVQLLVHNENHTKDLSREDVGFGSGIAKTLADAHESGAKEAVTDALKRCFRSFGNQFGNSLYDKSKNHQINQAQNQTNYPPNNGQQSQRTNQPQNYQNQTANNRTTPPPQRQTQSYDPYEYESLNRIGLEVMEDNGFLIVTGDDQFSKKDSIKACGFRFDGASKTWYKALKQAA